MVRLLPLTPEQLARAEELLRHPPPGSKIEAAKRFGVDLTLIVSKLRKTPDERFRLMHDACVAAELVRGAARRKTA